MAIAILPGVHCEYTLEHAGRGAQGNWCLYLVLLSISMHNAFHSYDKAEKISGRDGR